MRSGGLVAGVGRIGVAATIRIHGLLIGHPIAAKGAQRPHAPSNVSSQRFPLPRMVNDDEARVGCLPGLFSVLSKIAF